MAQVRIAKAKGTNKYFYPLILFSNKNIVFDLFVSVLEILTLFYASLDQLLCPVSHIWDILIKSFTKSIFKSFFIQ